MYDAETGLYYLQSRYYDPELGRFINADGYTTTGQGLLGNNMFVYCYNNPIMYKDTSGYFPWTAFEMLNTWLNGDGTDQYYSKKSRIVKQLKKSSKMQAAINTAIENYKAGQSVTFGYGEFTSEEDGWDLYLSTQHFSYTITVEKETRTVGFLWWKHKEERYVATVEVYDRYDFNNLREWNSFGNIMNNLAYIYHIFGGGDDYEWFATYTYTTKWEDVP